MPTAFELNEFLFCSVQLLHYHVVTIYSRHKRIDIYFLQWMMLCRYYHKKHRQYLLIKIAGPRLKDCGNSFLRRRAEVAGWRYSKCGRRCSITSFVVSAYKTHNRVRVQNNFVNHSVGISLFVPLTVWYLSIHFCFPTNADSVFELLWRNLVR